MMFLILIILVQVCNKNWDFFFLEGGQWGVEPSLSLLSMTRSLNHGVLLSPTIPPPHSSPPLIPLPLFPIPPLFPRPHAHCETCTIWLNSTYHWELRTPPPLTRRRVCLSPHRFRGGHTRLQEKGWGVPIRTRGQTLCYFIHCLTNRPHFTFYTAESTNAILYGA